MKLKFTKAWNFGNLDGRLTTVLSRAKKGKIKGKLSRMVPHLLHSNDFCEN